MKTAKNDPYVTWSITDMYARNITKGMKEGVTLPLAGRGSTLVSVLVSQGFHNKVPQTWYVVIL